MTSNLITGARLYFVNKKISRLENEREKVLAQTRPDMMLQGLMMVGKYAGEISKEIRTLEHKKIKLENKLSNPKMGFIARTILAGTEISQSANETYGTNQNNYSNNSQYNGGTQ